MSETQEQTSTKTEFQFEAEVSRLLQLMVHSVYSNKDVFLREVISNAADACEKLRYLSAQDASLTADNPDFVITVTADAEAKTLTIADNGVGMNREDLIENLGTIAKSGTRAFLDQMKAGGDGSALIGQFGVGFYSVFMVAERVEVLTRKAGEKDVFVWSSTGTGSYQITEGDAAALPQRGTQVVLYLNDDGLDYTNDYTLRRVIKEYSAHVPVPIDLLVVKAADEADGAEKDGDADPADDAAPKGPERLTDGGALWTKSKSDIEDKDYADFYRHVSGQYDDPAMTVHYRAEGRHEYTTLAFVPTSQPFGLFDPERKGGMKLYVRRVFITDKADLVPAYLRFVRGLVDSEDLSLNLSREMLQTDPVLEQIRKGVTNRVLSDLSKLAEKDAKTYSTIWEAFGAVLKEGLYEDFERRDKLLDLMRFKSTSSDENWRSLKDYVADLKENQTEIYYVLADNLTAAKSSPHLEGFKKRGLEVIYLHDPVDAFWVRMSADFDGKPLKSVTQGDIDLSAIASDEPEAENVDTEKSGTLAGKLKEALGEEVSLVRVSTRLADSPVCLVAADGALDSQLEKILSRADQAKARSAPVLEINPSHPLIAALAEKAATGSSASEFDDIAHVLHGQARVLDGEAPSDPADFARRLSNLATKAFTV